MPFADNPLENYRGKLDSLPLKIGVSSFVWPAGYFENIKRLKGIFSEVQLLAYEPAEQSPVGRDELDGLRKFRDEGFTYSLHLHAPSGLAHPGGTAERDIAKTIGTFAPLDIGNYVLHVENGSAGFNPELAARRIGRIIDSTGVSPEKICVENLVGTPFGPVWEAVEPLGVSICMDAGHLLVEGEDPAAFMRRHGPKIRMAHVHGVDGRDHRPLSALPLQTLAPLFRGLAGLAPRGAVIIENFSLGDVVESVRCLSHGAKDIFGGGD